MIFKNNIVIALDIENMENEKIILLHLRTNTENQWTILWDDRP